jgi:hypothetical protein
MSTSAEDQLRQEQERRERFRSYFLDDDVGKRFLHLRTVIKRVMIFVGGVLWVLTAPVSLYQGYKILHDGLTNTPLIEIAAVLLGLFVAGGVMIAIANWNWLWIEVLHNFKRYFFLLILTPLGLLTAWAVHRYFGSETWRNAIGLGSVLVAAIGLLFRRRRVTPQAEIEKELDDALLQFMERNEPEALRGMRAARGANEDVLLLRRFPNDDEPGPKLLGRPGHDHRPRINPQGFLALRLGPTSVVSYEGLIDLVRGELVCHCVREFDYRDITVLSLTGSRTANEAAGERAGMGQVRLLAGIPKRVDRHEFCIGLPGGASIRAVVSDGPKISTLSGFAEPQLRIDPLTRWEEVQNVWRLLSERKRAAAARA